MLLARGSIGGLTSDYPPSDRVHPPLLGSDEDLEDAMPDDCPSRRVVTQFLPNSMSASEAAFSPATCHRSVSVSFIAPSTKHPAS